MVYYPTYPLYTYKDALVCPPSSYGYLPFPMNLPLVGPPLPFLLTFNGGLTNLQKLSHTIHSPLLLNQSI